VDRHPLIASMLFCAFMIAGMVALVPNIHSPLGLAAAWASGASPGGAVSGQPCAPDEGRTPSASLAASLNIAGANLGIGLGAMIGGRVIDSAGLAFWGCGCRVHSVVVACRLMSLKREAAPRLQAVNSSRRAPSVIATMPGCLTLRSTEMA
jgi:predicted MFS family arabinose efflux permease